MRNAMVAFNIAMILVLSAAFCLPLEAQEASRGTTFVALVIPGAEADPSLRKTLQAIVRVQLARRRLSCVLAEGQESQTARSIRALAAKEGATYALLAAYRTAGEKVTLDLDLRDGADGTSLASASGDGQIGLFLDAIVSELLDRLLADRTLRQDTAAAAAREDARRSSGADAAGARPAAILPATEPGAARQAPRWRWLGVSAGASPLVLGGPAADFAKLGLLGTAAVGVRIPAGGGTLTLGLLSGFGWLHAEGVVTSADIALVPAGLDARYAPAAGAGIGLSLHLSGGAALMRVSPAMEDAMTKIVPYGLAGMTLDLPLTATFGLAVEASFAAFLEASVPILAFSPSLSARVRV